MLQSLRRFRFLSPGYGDLSLTSQQKKWREKKVQPKRRKLTSKGKKARDLSQEMLQGKINCDIYLKSSWKLQSNYLFILSFLGILGYVAEEKVCSW